MAPLVGMSLYTWTAIISVVLAGFSLGHWIGGLLASKVKEPARAERYLVLTLLLAGLTVTAAIAALPLAPMVIDLVGGVRVTTVLLLTTILFLGPSLVAGVVTPLATALEVERAGSRERGRVLARMFAASAFGAIAGVLITGYSLVPMLGATGAMGLIACVQGFLALRVWRGSGGNLVGALVGAVSVGMATAGSLLITQTICDEESQYYCLKSLDTTEITGFPSQGLEIDRWLHSIEDRSGADRLFIESHDFVDSLARRDNAGLAGVSALFIGGGGLTLPELWRREAGVDRLLVLEIDPAVTAFARRNLEVEVTEPLRVLHADARVGIRGLSRDTRFNVIYNDAYTGLTMPAHLVTLEFHREVRGRLMEDGFYVVNLIDSPRAPRFLASLAKTLGETFEVVEVWRRQGMENRNRRLHYGLVARHAPSAFDTITSRGDPSRRWERLDEGAVERLIGGVPALLLTDDLAPVDLLLANFCSLSFLRVLSLGPTRPEACS